MDSTSEAAMGASGTACSMRILSNISKMLQRRGVVEDSSGAFDELKRSYNSIDKVATVGQIRIRIHMDFIKNIGKVQDIVTFIQASKPSRVIIVTKHIASRPFKDLMALRNVEIFWMYELLNDIACNSLIPAHRRLDADEKQTFFAEYGIGPAHLPRMDKTDFIVRYMNYSEHDVIEIKRPSSNSGVSVAYRVVNNVQWDKLFA